MANPANCFKIALVSLIRELNAMFGRILIGLLLLILQGCGHITTVQVGDTPVRIIKTTVNKTDQPKHFVHVHENETTALRAAMLYTRAHGGTVMTLKHSGQRNIVFHMDNVRYEVDPNRIYTDTGIRKSLTLYGAYSPKAHQAVKNLADHIKQSLPKEKVIAVHNNRGYSIRDYFPHHSLSKDAKKINYKPKTNARNFYFVTRQAEYLRLVRQSFNVALQSLAATDDGSLSYYLANRNYINIEAAFDQLSAQLKMLEYA